LFLICVTAHALLGVRAVLFDFGFGDRAERLMNQALAVVGVLTVGYGLWLTWIIIRWPKHNGKPPGHRTTNRLMQPH
jgi:succinate dehydrogenase/fumarate reductase cytochrome b subunit